MYTFNVIYPDSLIDVWRYLQKQPAENCKKPLSEAEVVKAWSDFRLTIMPEAAEMSRKFGVSSVDDAASDFLTALFMGPCPSEIATAGTLKKRAKKYFAEKWNPCGKEVYDALAKAVRAMVRKGVLARSEPDKNIGPTTRFWIADVTPTHTAMPEECEREFPRIPRVGSRERSALTAHKGLLTPTDAQAVVLALFKLMGNSVRICMQELMSCALNRTRNVIVPFAESYEETDKDDQGEEATDATVEADESSKRDHEEGALAGMSAKNLVERLARGIVSDDEVVPEAEEGGKVDCEELEDWMDGQRYRRCQLDKISRAAAERIWGQVLKSNWDKLFCLYTLPKFSGAEVKTRLADFGENGDARRPSENNEKIKSILQSELQFVIKNPDLYRFGPDNALRRVRLKLIGRCAEKGHEVPL